MAKCDLSIELDDPDRVYPGGGKISGVVKVRTDADVTCKGLEVRTVWKTHGRGNVTSGIAQAVTVYEGAWRSGESAEYRFELSIADWPPSYHGHYLNVDHYVEAQAKIPWAFDPQVAKLFLMRPSCGPEGAVKTNAVQMKGVAGCVIGVFIAIFVLVFGAIALTNIFMLAFVMLVPMIGGLFYLFRVVLPKFRLGEVTCELHPNVVSPGASVAGMLSIRPRRNVPINGIQLRFEAREQCVSGSGSNRTTHKHVFFDKVESLEAATMLQAGQLHQFPFSVELPGDAPYSVDLDDNDLIWRTELVVDIPRWPDWRQEMALQVVPSGKQSESTEGNWGSFAGESAETFVRGAETGPIGADESLDDDAVTFDETAGHLWSVRDNGDSASVLADAVAGLTFSIEAEVERRLLYSGTGSDQVYKNGYAIWAHYTDPPLPLVLYVPHELGDEFEQLGQGTWRGRATVLGWDREHRRLRLKVEP